MSSMFIHYMSRFYEIHVLTTWISWWAQLGFLLLQWNTITKRQTGEESVCLVHISISLFVIQGSQNRNSNKGRNLELVQRPWRVLHTDFLLRTCSSSFLMQSGTTSPGITLPTIGWVFPHWSLKKKMPYSLLYHPILWRHFLN